MCIKSVERHTREGSLAHIYSNCTVLILQGKKIQTQFSRQRFVFGYTRARAWYAWSPPHSFSYTLKKKKNTPGIGECHCCTDRITDRWYSVKKSQEYIDSLDRYDETNYLDVLFTADGYDAVSFSCATSANFPRSTAIGPARCIFWMDRSVLSLNFIPRHRLVTIFICKQQFTFYIGYFDDVIYHKYYSWKIRYSRSSEFRGNSISLVSWLTWNNRETNIK